MTAFALTYTPNRVIVASDTLGYVPNRREAKPLGFIPKILPLPHLQSLLFGRGQMALLYRAGLEFMLAPQLRHVEAAAEVLPDLMRKLTSNYAIEMDLPADWESLGIFEGYLIGWSEQVGRMRAWQFSNTTSYRLVGDTAPKSIVATCPELPAARWPSTAGLSPDRQLIALMKALRSYFEDEPELLCGARLGGEIVSWELRPGGMLSHRVLERFSDYQEVRNAGAAVASRIARDGNDQFDLADALVSTSQMRSIPAPPEAIMSRAERRRAERAAKKVAKHAA
jgi:hypothetical protein